MRLLHHTEDGEYRLTDNLVDDIPPYAILSHTWLADDQEVNFEDLTRGNARRKAAGYRKIEFCGEQAEQDDLKYFWVDTCCIDKSSSAELSEAITAMFNWYRNSIKCYAYLVDVSVAENVVTDPSQSPPWETAFRRSRWFTRGWTLQELLAPSSVEFFSKQCVRLGDKQSLERYIHEITKIPHQALRGVAMTNFSVGERLAWTVGRSTKRKEDMAYCLLGVFNVFLPLMYGEGDHAFARLREEIDKTHAESAKLDRWLSNLPIARQAAFNSLDNQHESTCLPNTRVELLQDIRDWIDGTDNRCIFWLNGIAGTGKSTVARTIARTYHDRGILGASFFFSRGGGDVAHADKLFTTIAWQLANKIPQIRWYICEAIMEQKNIAEHSLRDQWDHLIINPLSRFDSKSDLSTIVIVIDALDECDSERDIRIILRLLAMTRSLSNIRLRVFITSRPEISVRCGFSQIPEAERQVFVLHDILPALVDRDIGLFFEQSFVAIREERGFGADWPGMQIIKRLVEISGGLFIWASTACRFIRAGRRLAMRRISLLLRGIHSGAGPEKQLDSIYTTVLKDSIHKGYADEEKQELFEMLREVLGSIVVLFSPLSVDCLGNLLSLEPSEIYETLADFHTVFNIPSQRDRPIRLHHPTFRDFILNKDRCRDLNFWIDEKQAHKAVADNCVQLMSKLLKRDICGLKSPGTLTKDIDPKLIEKKISPELQYACLYWVQHYRESGTRLHDDDEAHRFFEHYFLYWLEAMNVMGKTAEVAAIIRMYASLLVPEENPLQFPFVQDARRFIFAFQSIIEYAPLQTYCAALAFSQSGNEVKQHFSSQMHYWIQDVRIAEAVTHKTKKQKTSRTFFVNDIVFTPDGRQIASGSVDPEIRVWDVGTKATLGRLKGHTNKVSSVSLTTDGTFIASGSDDATLIVWDWETRAVRQTLKGHSRWVNSVSFSVDGKLLASGSMDETVRIWDIEKGREMSILKGDSGCVNAVAFSPDGSLVASAATDQIVRLWDIREKELRIILDGHSGAVNSVQFSPDGKRVISGADDMTVKIWDASTGTEYTTLKGHHRRVMTVAFSPDSTTIASGSEDMTIKLWDAASGQLLSTLSGHTSGINAVVFSPDSRLLASGSFNEEVRLWNARTGESLGEFDEFEIDATTLTEKMKSLNQLAKSVAKGHSSIVISVVFSPDGQLVASGSHDTTIKLWTRDGEERWLLKGHSGSINSLAFSPDTRLLASASTDKTAKVWNTETGATRYTLEGHSNNVRLIQFSSDGQFLASCSTDKTVILWTVNDGQIWKRLEGHSDTVNDVTFSPQNNNLVASGSADSTIRLWDVSTGVTSVIFRGHSDTVNSIAFSSDGKFLISGSADKTIRLWDTSGVTIGLLIGHNLPVNSAAFSPDNKKVVSSSDDGTVRLWDFETKSELSFLKSTIAVRKVSFADARYIDTDRGRLDSGSFSSTSSPSSSGSFSFTSTSSSLATPPPLFAAKDWVRRGEENIISLPNEYRATSVGTMTDNIVLGHATGSISFIRF